MNKIFIAVICIIIVFLIYQHYKMNKVFKNELEGFWVMEDDFAEKADISHMLLYIGPKEGTVNQKHNCYLSSDISNQKFEMSYWPTLGSVYNASFLFEDEPIFPEAATVSCELQNGFLTIVSNGTIYGVFIKDNKLSNLII